MKVLLIGSGGREHVLAWKLSQSKQLKQLYCAPGNPGTAQHGTNVDISDTDIDELLKFAVKKKIDLAVVGPEDPLAAGIVDLFEAAGIKTFGPSKAAAALEGDKVFAKKIMHASAIPTAEARDFDNFEDAKTYIATRDCALVVKAAGLAKGKGVFVCNEPADAILVAEDILVNNIFSDAGKQILVEEKLLGQEASILAFVDGHSIYIIESAQDHKPIGEGDTGPNTGGMGAYTPAPIVTEKLLSQIEREIFVPIIDGLNRSGVPYRGILYAGLMLTAGGPKVIEFNARFGDPEAQPILMRLKNDLLEVILATCEGRLDKQTLKWDTRPAVCVVMASKGYPGDYEKGLPITGIDDAEKLGDVKVFHAGTAIKEDQLVTNGGRVLGVTALGKTIEEAQQLAYAAAEKIHFPGAYYRKDIAAKALK
jgi:phosphoribosylamine--glycine ligase